MIGPCYYRELGLMPYQTVWQAMRDFTIERSSEQADEIWSCQHHPVYTQGQAGKTEHILRASSIPIVQSDRGGQVTYHGPGQIIIYVLLDLKRHQLTVRNLVCTLEQSVIHTLASYDVVAYARRDAPGVYVDNAKICSLGLRIKRGYSYHGLALNVDMDLSPFQNINPCGHHGLSLTQLCDHNKTANLTDTQTKLIENLSSRLNLSLTTLNDNNIGTAA